MAWLKAGDTAAMDERVLNIAALAGADERSVNEVFGFVMRLYLQAAQQETDYLVSFGTAMVLSPRYEELLAMAVRTGLVTLEELDGLRMIRLCQDPEFMHVRPREELQWERDRKADAAKPDLTVPVRVRDGDACRYCGVVVSFGARRGGRAGTYDHLVPGKRARDEHEMVVACQACNSGRRDAEGTRGAKYVLLPPPSPETVYYSKSTLAWFETLASVFAQQGLTIPRRPKGARDRKVGTQSRQDVQPLPASSSARGTHETENAASAPSGDQRPASASTPPADAAPLSGDQRAAATSAPLPAAPAPVRADAAPSAPATATSASSEGTRAGATSEPPSAAAGAVEMQEASTGNPWVTRADDVSAEPAETEATESGDPGSGRDGPGRAGTGLTGSARGAGPRPQGAPPPPPPADGGAGAGRRRRGRRGKRRKS